MTLLFYAGETFSKTGEICCTWSNSAYVTDSRPQKLIFNYDGTYEVYSSIKSTDASERGVFEIAKKWEDSEGNILYNIKMLGMFGTKFKLAKISSDGEKLEFVSRFNEYPAEINRNSSSYGHYLITSAGAHTINDDLIEAARNNDVQSVKMLIEKGADVNARGDFLGTPLIVASKFGHYESAKELVKAGADIDAKCFLDCTPLLWSAEKGYGEIVKLLLNNGANIEASDISGWTALMKATFQGNIEIVKILVEKGANVNVKNSYGYSALYIGEKLNRQPDLLNVLVEAGAAR
jgi:hypothetical protein